MNNCSDRTEEVATAAGARVVTEAEPGYGCALRRGMAEASGDVFVWVEADGSFKALDLNKFLSYLDQNTLVLGTRTPAQMVQQGREHAFDPALGQRGGRQVGRVALVHLL